MAVMLDRRELLKSLGWGTLAVGAGGAMQTAVPAWAESAARQGTPPRAGIPRIIFSRASLANGIIPHSGETSMELYHNHPHLEKEEIVQPEDIRLQTRLTMRNHKEILDWLGLDWKNVVKVTRFQKRLDESKAIEEVMADYFRDMWPPMSVYEIEGLSSPQARVEIEMWVVPNSEAVQKWTQPAPVKGLFSVLPRPEVVARTGYAPGILVSKDMDLVFMSALTAYPFNVDPWNPGEFRLPTDAAARGKMATQNLERIIQAAGITWQHLIFRVSFTAPGGGGVPFQERQGDWRSCSTSLRVTDTGVPGVNVLYHMTAAAPRRAAATKGPVPGVEPLLVEPGMTLAPAIRVRSDVDLIYFSGITAYPIDVDPLNPGSYRLPQDTAAQEKLLVDNVDRMLKMAGITWQHIVVLDRTGEGAPFSSMTERMGTWRPCRSTRAVTSGVPGAKVLCDITAVAPRRT
jgi:enamine deaminase RidA (YjgF/YER057c/UK114 family)